MEHLGLIYNDLPLVEMAIYPLKDIKSDNFHGHVAVLLDEYFGWYVLLDPPGSVSLRLTFGHTPVYIPII